jgi:hypothetical protein
VTCPIFSPRPLTNLAKLDETPSLAPITDMHVVMPSASAAAAAAAGTAISGAAGVSAAAPQVRLLAGTGGGTVAIPLPSPPLCVQVVTLCGRGPRSTLRLLREGVAVSEVAQVRRCCESVSLLPSIGSFSSFFYRRLPLPAPSLSFFFQAPMPGNPMAIFTVRGAHTPAVPDSSDAAAAAAESAASDRYVVMSFTNATLVMSVGETMEEVAAKVRRGDGCVYPPDHRPELPLHCLLRFLRVCAVVAGRRPD